MKNFKVGFPIASVWFGALVGTSLLTGVFGTVYFAPYGGAWSLILVLITTLISVVVSYFAMETIRRNKAYDFGTLTKAWYGKYSLVFGILIDLYMLISTFTGAGSMVATMGGILNQLFGIPEWTGFIVLAIVASILAIFGAKAVRAAGSVMSVLLIAGLFIITGTVIYVSRGNWGTILTNWTPMEGYSIGTGIRKAAILGGYGCGICLTFCSVSQNVETKRHSLAFFVCSLVMIFGAYLLSSLMVQPFISDCINENIPVLSVITNNFGKAAGIGTAIYTITMFLAIVSSAVPAMLACTARVDRYYPRTGKFANPVVRNVITAAIYWIAALLFSLLGLKTIVGGVYTYLGYICIALVVVPTIIIQPIKWAKEKKAAATEM